MKNLYGNYQYTKAYPDELTDTIDQIISTHLKQPNKWGYSWYRYPEMSSNGLMYQLDSNIKFSNIKETTIESSQRIFIDIYTKILKEINNIRQIRPFLDTFPVNIQTYELVIGFEDEQTIRILPPNISGVMNCNNFLEFREFDKKNLTPHKLVFKKPISEIKELNELYSVSIPRSSVTPKPNIPELKHLSRRQNSPSGRAEFVCAETFAKENNLKVITIGCVGKHYFDTHPMQFALRGSQNYDLKKARTLGASCFKQALTFAQTDKNYIHLFQERSKNPSWKDPATIAEPRHIAFRISFWDENVDRVPQPYIAEIRVIGENFQYFTADEGQRLQLVHEETFDEAMSFLEKERTQASQ